MELDFAAGWFGGVASVLVGQPFDTIKVRLQTQSSANLKYTGTFHCFLRTFKEESIFGLYRGVSSPLLGIAFIASIGFGVNGWCLKKLQAEGNGQSLRNVFYSGAAAGLVQSFICSPMELAKLHLQLQGQGIRPRHIFFYYDPPLPYRGPVDCLLKIYRQFGMKGVARGLPITIVRDVPSYGIYFASYEWLVRLMAPDGNVFGTLGAGGLAGVLSWLIYPVDVIKSRFQADDGVKYRNVLDCIRKTHRAEGWRVYTYGFSATMLRAFPTNAVTFLAADCVYRVYIAYSTHSPVTYW